MTAPTTGASDPEVPVDELDGLFDDEAAQLGQDRYERTVLGWGCD
jgi:hypothetical protein